MMGCDEAPYLRPSDIEAVERLVNHALDGRLKERLLYQYGERGPYHLVQLAVRGHMGGCRSACREGCYCVLAGTESLLSRVFRMVACFERGVFDPQWGNERDIFTELTFTWASHGEAEEGG